MCIRDRRPVEYSSLDLSLRWHYPAAPGDAATSRGGQVRRVGARKRLLSSSARSSAGPPQCTAGTTAGPRLVSPCPATVHSPLWRMWIRTLSRACRLTTAVDKTLTTTTSLHICLLYTSPS